MKKFQNITKKQIEHYGVQALSDRPNSAGAYGGGGLSPLELKLWFDQLATFEANKINEIHNILASDEAAEYIAVTLHDNGIHDLSQLVAAIKSGALSNILELYPTFGSDKRVNLQNAIYDIAKLLSDHDHDINEVLKKPPFTEYDPTVPAWAKKPNPPTADDVGAPVKGTEAPNATATYIKPVPADAAPYAEVVEIGGMTYKDGDTLSSAPVTEVESVGVNLINPSELMKASQKEVTLNGDVFTANVNSATIYINSISIGNAVVLPAGTYTVSVVPLNDIYLSVYVYAKKNNATLFHIGVGKHTNIYEATFTANEPFILSIGGGWNSAAQSAYTGSFAFKLQLVRDSTSRPYRPYTRNTLPIPEAVRALDGYGWGINEQVYNYIDWKKKQFVKRVGVMSANTIGWQGMASNLAYSLQKSKPYAKCLCALPSGFRNIIFDDQGAIVVYFDDGLFESIYELSSALEGVMLYYELATPIITDISNLLPADNLIGVEAGGTVRMVNEYGYDVPNTVTFYVGKNEVVGAETFVGDLYGTAARAMADGEGKQLATREWVLEQLAALMSGGE